MSAYFLKLWVSFLLFLHSDCFKALDCCSLWILWGNFSFLPNSRFSVTLLLVHKKKKICKSLRGYASFHSNCKCLSDELPVRARDWSSGWDYLCSSHWGLENLTSGCGKGWREGTNWLGSGKKSPPPTHTPITFHWTRTELHTLEIVFNFLSRKSYHGLSLARFQGLKIFLKG